MTWLAIFAAVLSAGVLTLAALRWRDHRADRAAIAALLARQPADPPRFRAEMVADLPDPAARFFRFAISAGAPLRMAAEIRMGGELALGAKDAARASPMKARQILAPPHGLVWRVRTGGAMRVSGCDALTARTSWSRFRLLGLIPVARAGGDADHRLSAFGRMVGEGLFWTPAAFLPAANAGWEALSWTESGPDVATVSVRFGGMEQSADLHVADDGRPLRVIFMRWSNENPERAWRRQPFGGDLGGFKVFGGYRLPTRVDGGNHFGTPDYHPFFRARDATIRFPGAG